MTLLVRSSVHGTSHAARMFTRSLNAQSMGTPLMVYWSPASLFLPEIASLYASMALAASLTPRTALAWLLVSP